jgi:hypothetical protein
MRSVAATRRKAKDNEAISASMKPMRAAVSDRLLAGKAGKSSSRRAK